MSFHHDPSNWLFEAQKENCPYCRKDEDPMQSVTLKFFKYSELCAHPRVSLEGTCYLITREHYVELFDLNDEALLGFMKEVQVTAKVLKDVTGAFKINYEMHGNTAPHLHLHLFLRYLNDPFAGIPIDYNRIEPPVYTGNEFEIFISSMQERLEAVEIESCRGNGTS
jgi:diadenosine tetraphosphate (Ap4A) HIT family hydrolase